MAKRKTIGSVVKTKDGRDAIKISQDVSLKAGTYLNLENEASQVAGITAAEAKGTLSNENAEKALARVAKTPFVRKAADGTTEGFVRFEIVLVEK